MLCSSVFAFDSLHYVAVPFVSAVGLFDDRNVMYSSGRRNERDRHRGCEIRWVFLFSKLK